MPTSRDPCNVSFLFSYLAQATAAATAAAAAMENNSIPKVLKDNNLIIDATELGKLNTKSASCAVQLATPAMDAIDCVPLLKGCLGSLEFSLKPGCWLDLKIAILVKDKGWRWFPTRLTSLELLDSAYNGGLRGRFPSVLTMAAALEDFEMGIITIDSLVGAPDSASTNLSAVISPKLSMVTMPILNSSKRPPSLARWGSGRAARRRRHCLAAPARSAWRGTSASACCPSGWRSSGEASSRASS